MAKARRVAERVHWVGVVDWDRRLFDALIPLPDGTSYNAYVVRGSEKTALIDAVEPGFEGVLFERLADLGVDRLDYLVANHAEQDHSGGIPALLERFPGVQVVATKRGAQMLGTHLGIPEASVRVVEDGAEISLGDRTLRFYEQPWVHWPETMVTWLAEDRVLFPCDLFGSHLATTDLFARDEARVLAAARLYYAQIMMPFRKFVTRGIERAEGLEPAIVAPSHGPIFDRPSFAIDAWKRWNDGPLANKAVVAFVSMHGSTLAMVDHLVEALTERGVGVERFDLVTADLGRVASALVDAATVIVGTPTVLGGAHPLARHAAALVGALKPRVRFASVIGSYGWGSKATKDIAEALAGLDVEVLEPVSCKGLPDAEARAGLDRLAASVAEKHAEIGLGS